MATREQKPYLFLLFASHHPWTKQEEETEDMGQGEGTGGGGRDMRQVKLVLRLVTDLPNGVSDSTSGCTLSLSCTAL